MVGKLWLCSAVVEAQLIREVDESSKTCSGCIRALCASVWCVAWTGVWGGGHMSSGLTVWWSHLVVYKRFGAWLGLGVWGGGHMSSGLSVWWWRLVVYNEAPCSGCCLRQHPQVGVSHHQPKSKPVRLRCKIRHSYCGDSFYYRRTQNSTQIKMLTAQTSGSTYAKGSGCASQTLVARPHLTSATKRIMSKAAPSGSAAVAVAESAAAVPTVTKPTLFDVPVSNNGARVSAFMP